MKLSQIALVVALSAVTAFGVTKYTAAPAGPATEAKKETRLEQVKRTGVLRCGYYLWPPFLDKDLTTGEMKGMFAELINEIGKQLNVKVQWSTEILHDQIPTDLASNRYDMLCGMLFATPTRAREMAFTTPLLIHPAYLFVRADDHRFDNNYEAANDPSIKFAILDGEYSAIAANERYPRAQKVALPQNASGPELLLNVSGKKADIVATEAMTYALFNKSNPGQLRRVEGPPESIIEASFPLPLNEPAFKNTIDTTMTYLHGTGFINKLLDKYETTDIKFLRMPKPYIVKEGSNAP